VLGSNKDPRVRVYTVWVPKRRGLESDVAQATATMPDARARHFWDGAGYTLHAYTKPLALPEGIDAWDVYLLYGPDARWDGPLPPMPDFWMHQLSGVENAPELDREVFGQRLAQTLAEGVSNKQ
jgi:hypothetical protein